MQKAKELALSLMALLLTSGIGCTTTASSPADSAVPDDAETDGDTGTDGDTDMGGDAETNHGDIDAVGTVYYVSNHGDDSHTGTSSSAPWETLSKVNSFDFSPGDVIRFERGGEWRGQLMPHSGDMTADIVYTSYGTGNKPILMDSVSMNENSDWTNLGGNIWATSSTSLSYDIGNIIFNNSEVGIRCSSEGELNAQNEFWYDSAGRQVEIYSTTNPAELYQSIDPPVA